MTVEELERKLSQFPKKWLVGTLGESPDGFGPPLIASVDECMGRVLIKGGDSRRKQVSSEDLEQWKKDAEAQIEKLRAKSRKLHGMHWSLYAIILTLFSGMSLIVSYAALLACMALSKYLWG